MAATLLKGVISRKIQEYITVPFIINHYWSAKLHNNIKKYPDMKQALVFGFRTALRQSGVILL